MDRGKTGALIASARRTQGLTQQALAGRVHVTAKAVSKWERGYHLDKDTTLIPR